ncbi:hypothetical protein [Actinomyces ruminicola]|uniref:Uncharacterized protein n=1 Tax=Actinomyces ruminicola TaxID=332524 RepID=A0A1H0A6L1_9ACTO|nr:hypothetical protein [Actinomyces ruminicola]SDN28851.1 hypothetical protein SAMN04487766_1229 [Actinomyces ruminicola]
MTEQRAHPEMGASWAPVGWEPSDIGFDDAPFGTVLGDPLMGSPIFDVSVLDAAPASDGNAAGDAVGARPPQVGTPRRAATRSTTLKQHQQSTQQPSHRQSAARPQAQPASPSPAVTGNRRNPYAPVQAQRPQPATPSATAYGPPPQPAEHNPYGRPPAPPGTGPTPRPASQGDDTKSIEKLVAAGIGWVVFILFMIIFASM